MKTVLITGANSYIGMSLDEWLDKKEYKVSTLDMREEQWMATDFSIYDCVVHVAGIVHMKETKENCELYYKVNRDLVYEVAKKVKQDGVKQFIFLRSMSVYGIETGSINKETVPNPKSNYGKSKLEAEKLVKSLDDVEFKVAILRPPMVYGEGCKGNYQRLVKFALKSPVFPNIENKRSMIFIDRLCESVKSVIDNNGEGLYLPQDDEYICTSQMVKAIAEEHGKKIHMTRVFNPILWLLRGSLVNKVFGDLVYERDHI